MIPLTTLSSRAALLGGLTIALHALALPLSGQNEASLTSDLVRQVLSSPEDGAAWSALESEAVAAADGPFVLRDLRVDEATGGLLLELGGYGLPSLEQVMKAGSETKLVVSLPGARSALPHGYELAGAVGMTEVRVRQVPFGVEVEARLPAGTAAVIDETAEGVRVRSLGAAPVVAPETAPGVEAAPRGLDRAALGLMARTWMDALRAGRPLAVFPLAGIGALSLLLVMWLAFRRRPVGRLWHSVADAQRLAEKLSSPRNW